MKLAMKPNLTRGGNSRQRGFFALRGLLAPSIDCMVDQRNFRRAVSRKEVRVVPGKVEKP